MIAEIEAMQPSDELYDAKVKVLGEYIKHHVKEEEQPGGIFAQAKRGDPDLDAMGERHEGAQGSAHGRNEAGAPALTRAPLSPSPGLSPMDGLDGQEKDDA